MDTRKIVESSRLVGSTSWAAIASGAVIAIALQTLLLLFGVAFAFSVGNGAGGGFAVWAIIVELFALAVGSALTARVARAEARMGGIVAGVMTWAVTFVLGTAVQGFAMPRTFERGGLWVAFIVAIAGLVAAVIGGALGANLGRPSPIAPPEQPPFGTPAHQT